MFIEKIEKDVLLKPLQAVIGIVARKQSLPILANVLIEKKGDTLRFVATDLEKPASLVRNDSEAGNYLSISLVGTKSHRDAIGTEVIAAVADKNWTQQLMGGCGYMVTNEKVIHFGLGSATKVDRIEIVWPSGVRQTYTDLPVNTHWIAIENQSLHKLL